ncbi:ABC-type bacteriocin/lantibiotic exporter with double-glycine peptidase domain [Oceanotoga teriensis]|uniref:ABC-type bacteriocin/lantibiotic exporter with double-glycine peptidase domain n=1 Tax=Oceanotoga teriensis TaxID=515440 RepID=A0AA45C800_9BACT|nr:ABC transporter ATP-binding protein [Oceanotoga teriensis]PWJ95674.1 ABC-type bacteriocin/lantibiotic exporter with double-glycine peptidase domain [Oceanotoga teriensis]
MNEFKWFFRNMPIKIKFSYILSFFFSLISSLLMMSIPIFYKFIIDSFQENNSEKILKSIVYFLIFNTFCTFFYWLGEYIFRSKSTASVFHYMKKTYIWSINNKKNINPEIIINDPLAFGNFSSVIYGIINIIKIPIPLIFIFLLDKNSFFIAFITIIIWFFYIKYDRNYVDKNEDEIIEIERKNFDFIDDSLKGFYDIKITSTFKYEFEKVKNKYWNWFKKIKFYIKKRNLYLLLFEILKILMMVGYIIYAFYGFYKNKYLLGTVFALIAYYDKLEGPIISSFYLNQQLGYYKKIINNLKSTFNDERENEEEKIVENIEEIKLENVDFSYTDKKILNDINLRIKKGDKIALIGKSGEGKTTLVKLITGEEKANKGNIFINSENIMNIKNIYEKIGVLSQNSHIFNRSIKENITMGRNIDEKKLKEVIELSGVKDFIEDLENGIYTITGQNGSYLSGGQRVRIALARMMLSEPEIIILDEPLEGVDKIKEEKVIENIKKYIKDKTVIIISHRFSILNMADRIIGLENGTIVLNDLKENALKSDNIFKSFFDAEKRMTFIKGDDIDE